MTPEEQNRDLKEYWEEQIELTETPAFRNLLREVEEKLRNAEDIHSIKNEQELYKRKGELEVLTWIYKRKDIGEQVLEALEMEVGEGY